MSPADRPSEAPAPLRLPPDSWCACGDVLDEHQANGSCRVCECGGFEHDPDNCQATCCRPEVSA